jgi:hypothetical protein
LRFDQSIAHDGFYTRQAQHLRRVGFVDPETGKRLIFLTNHFALPALTIAALYKQRWQVGQPLHDVAGLVDQQRWIAAGRATLTVAGVFLLPWPLLAANRALCLATKNALHPQP